MKDNHKLKSISFSLVTLFCVVLCIYIIKRPGKKINTNNINTNTDDIETSSDTSDKFTSAPSPDIKTPAGHIYYSMLNLIDSNAFHVNTKVNVDLKGNLIKGKRRIKSKIDITAPSTDNMKVYISGTTTDGKKITKSKSYYKDGWFYSSDESGKKRVQKSTDDVLSTVTFLTSMIKSASDKLDDVDISKKDNDTIYKFTVPKELANDCFSSIIKQISLDTKELRGVTGDIKTLTIKTQISPDNVIVREDISITGSVSKSIFTIPVNMKLSAIFKTLADDFSLDLPDWKNFPISDE